MQIGLLFKKAKVVGTILNNDKPIAQNRAERYTTRQPPKYSPPMMGSF